MNGLCIFGPLVTLILATLLEKRWQRLIALGLTILLGIGFVYAVTNEVQKAVWAQSRIRIGEPTRNLLLETLDDINAGKTSEAVALLTYMTENWKQIDLAPWMKSVDDIHRDFHQQKIQKKHEPIVDIDGKSATQR